MAGQLATRYAIAGQYSDLQAMLERERLDVLHVATPPQSHLPIGQAALEAGCHIFMEKPFALDAAQTDALLQAARRAGRRICVNYLYNFETPALELDELLARGALGEVTHLDTAYGYNLAGDYGMAALSDANHWVHALPGKLFHNVLDHVLAKLVRFIGDDSSVQATGFRMRPPVGIARVDAMPDELRFVLRSGSTTAFGLVSAHSRPVAHTLKLYATRDTVELDYAARSLVFAARQTQPSSLGRLFPAFVQARQFARNGWRNVGRFRRYEFHYFQPMRILLNRFYDAVEMKAEDPIAHSEILRVSRLIDAIVACLKESTTI